MAIETARRKTTALIAEVDRVELGVRLFEAVVGMQRPEGLTAQQAFLLLPDADKGRVIRAADAAMQMLTDAINNGVRRT